VFRTSSVLISAEGAERVFRSVEEVPPRLRTRLLQSTNSPDAATILIADRRGRREIARALRSLPASAQRRLVRSVLGNAKPAAAPRRAVLPRKPILAAILLVVALLLAMAFLFASRRAGLSPRRALAPPDAPVQQASVRTP
jgi:hypothetical protein